MVTNNYSPAKLLCMEAFLPSRLHNQLMPEVIAIAYFFMFDLLLCISSSAAARNRRHSIDAIPIILLRRMHASGDSEKALYNDNAFSLINSTKSTFKAILSENSIPNHTIRPTVYKAFGLFLANFSNVCFRTFPIPFGCRAQFFDSGLNSIVYKSIRRSLYRLLSKIGHSL